MNGGSRAAGCSWRRASSLYSTCWHPLCLCGPTFVTAVLLPALPAPPYRLRRWSWGIMRAMMCVGSGGRPRTRQCPSLSRSRCGRQTGWCRGRGREAGSRGRGVRQLWLVKAASGHQRRRCCAPPGCSPAAGPARDLPTPPPGAPKSTEPRSPPHFALKARAGVSAPPPPCPTSKAKA